MAVAATSRRVGHVFFIGNQLMEWRTAAAPARSSVKAAGALQELINTFRPDVVVTERLGSRDRKGDRAREITAALQRIAAENYVLDVSVERIQIFDNKYEEADALAALYPAIKPWVPRKRRHFDSEPAAMVLFDALAAAHVVLQRPTTTLAAAMS
ncbi:MAG: hypothetical protein ACOZAA_14410 [Pseudomonadota bacterium]